MSQLQLELEDELVALLGRPDQPLQQVVRELVILDLYRQKKISSGRAAELLGMSRLEFIQHASQAGIPYFSLNEDEWEAEVRRSEALC